MAAVTWLSVIVSSADDGLPSKAPLGLDKARLTVRVPANVWTLISGTVNVWLGWAPPEPAMKVNVPVPDGAL